jgi:hypothetical protein
MTAFTALERAALLSIFSETPALAPALEAQLALASVTGRENSGRGFFTMIAVADAAPRVDSPRVLGNETQARIAGLDYGLGIILFMEDGRLDLLEGFTYGESLAALDLSALAFEICREKAGRTG